MIIDIDYLAPLHADTQPMAINLKETLDMSFLPRRSNNGILKITFYPIRWLFIVNLPSLIVRFIERRKNYIYFILLRNS